MVELHFVILNLQIHSIFSFFDLIEGCSLLAPLMSRSNITAHSPDELKIIAYILNEFKVTAHFGQLFVLALVMN